MWIKLVFVFAIFGQSVFAIDYPKDTCGLRPLKPAGDDDPTRIVGGTTSTRGDWPWIISLQRNGNHVCGGSLINDQWIITAAHCLTANTNPTVYRIVFGLHDRSISDSWVITRPVQTIILHPSYNAQLLVNDIALMKLSTKVEPYTDYYMPICFPQTNDTFDGQTGFTVGWGATAIGGALLRYLSEVTTPIVTDAVCRQRYAAGRINTATQVCSGGSNKGACQGDSGGPFTVLDPNGSGKHILVGLTSWGIGCGQGGVYTRVSAFKSWVEGFTGPTVSYL